jgi:hypothetical protein
MTRIAFAVVMLVAAVLAGGCKFRIQRDDNVPMHALSPYPKAPR